MGALQARSGCFLPCELLLRPKAPLPLAREVMQARVRAREEKVGER